MSDIINTKLTTQDEIMQSTNIRIANKICAILLLSLALASCGGESGSRVDDITNHGGEGVSRVDDITNGGGGDFSRVDDTLNNSNSGSGSGGNSPPELTYLDCSNLDPDKVYLLGSFALSAGLYALTDMEDPSRFCVGFPENSIAPVISETGSLIYRQRDVGNQSAMILVQETLETENTATNWNLIYPAAPTANDIQLFDIAYRGIDMHVRLGAGNDEIYGSGTLLTDGEEPAVYLNGILYYQPDADSSLLGVMPNGSLLMRTSLPSGSPNLYLVDTSFNITQLTPPTEGQPHIHPTTKAFIDPDTGNQSVWIVASNGDIFNLIESRWSIDLVTNTIADDGVLSATPANVFVGMDKSTRISGSGEIFQVATYQDALDDYWIILKRALESAGTETAIIYSEEGKELGGTSWTSDQNPFVFILNNLVTGP